MVNLEIPFFDNLIWLTTEEAAKYLRKTANALRVMVHRGHLRARKFRRRLYFKKIELDELLETSQIVGGVPCQ
jgi:excisionase family DNA binding protein